MEFTKPEATDGDTDEAQRGKTHSGGHAANLTVAPLCQSDLHPGGGNRFAEADWWITWRIGGRGIEPAGTAGQGRAVFERQALLEMSQRFVRRRAIDLNVVGARMGVPWIQKPVIPSRLVTEEQESLGVHVEAPDRINSGRQTKPGERALSGLIRRELAKHAVGLVKGDEHLERGINETGQALRPAPW